jgi:hypothetical protein
MRNPDMARNLVRPAGKVNGSYVAGQMRTPPVGRGSVRYEPDSVRDFSRISSIQFFAAVLVQGTVGPFHEGPDLIAGGVTSISEPPAKRCTFCKGVAPLRGFIGATGPFQQTFAMAIPQESISMHNTREAHTKSGSRLPATKIKRLPVPRVNA